MVSELLFTGEKNALPGAELCRVLKVSPRELTRQIRRERKDGAPICATCGGPRAGYYLASSKLEMQVYCKRLLHRMGEVAATRSACLKTVEGLPDAIEQVR